MATQTLFQERRGELHQLVGRWDRRLRLQQVFIWPLAEANAQLEAFMREVAPNV